MALGAQSTERLVRAARAHDEDAVVELIRRCEAMIAAGLAAAGLNRYEPLYPDAQNQALLTIWQQVDNFRGESDPCSWMYRIARRSAASRTIDPEMRERRRQEHHQTMTAPSDLLGASQEDDIVERDLLAEVMSRLDEQDREIIVLRVVQELSTRETAELLFLSEGGVKARLHRAKKSAVAIVKQLDG